MLSSKETTVAKSWFAGHQTLVLVVKAVIFIFVVILPPPPAYVLFVV